MSPNSPSAAAAEVGARQPRMNPKVNAYRAGLRRGMISTRIQMTSTSEILGTLIPIAVLIGVLLFLRRSTFEGAEVALGAMGLPSIIALGTLFSAVMGISGVLAMDRTNGTLLRSKSVPGGTTGYLVGEITANAILTVIQALLVLTVGLILFPELEFASPGRWLLFALVLLIGLVATLAIGAIAGALVNGPKNMTLVMLPTMLLMGISGIFYPLVALAGWVQVIAQIFPLYWFGLGMRAALLPDSMAAVEVGGSWRLEWVFIVLIAWSIVGLALAPKLLSRMARRESGSTLAARREGLQRDWGV